MKPSGSIAIKYEFYAGSQSHASQPFSPKPLESLADNGSPRKCNMLFFEIPKQSPQERAILLLYRTFSMRAAMPKSP
jgi:hypothetical protein